MNKFLAEHLLLALIISPFAVGWGFLATGIFHGRSPWWVYSLICMCGSLGYSVVKYIYHLRSTQ